MKKRFVLWMVLCMLFTMSMGIAVPAYADGEVGDLYRFEQAGYPMKHWVYMTEDEIEAYQFAGWEMYVGTLWIDQNDEVVEFQQVKTSEIQDLYNQGNKFIVYYTWLHDGATLGKYQEQSVSVGVWKYSPEQAANYYRTFEKAEIKMTRMTPKVFYLSQWYYDGVACDGPSGSEKEEDLNKLNFVRYHFDNYNFGYGSDLYLRNGNCDEFTYQEAVQVNDSEGFQNEMPAWGAMPR